MNGIKIEKEYSSEDDEDAQMNDQHLFGLLHQLESYTPTVRFHFTPFLNCKLHHAFFFH